MTRIPIRLNDECLDALRTLAKQQYRDVRQQAAWIIERELERCGLLPVDQSPVVILPAKESEQEHEERQCT